ncbi:MAG TPA: glycosyltransferase family 39 protein [Elusimicrobiota bacterium]|nr:glycosyltransferase family 39 protein [Elusimicrobiota bacterium]
MDFAETKDRLGGAKVFAAALAVRLAFLGFFLHQQLDRVFLRDVYYSAAMGWLGYGPKLEMDATHPPLYSIAIAAVSGFLRTPNPLPVLLLQAFLSAWTCLLLWRLAERLRIPGAGRWAALWAAVDPALVFYAPQLQTETLFAVLELGFFLSLYEAVDGGSPFVAGLLGSLASLCRSVFAAYPVFLIPALLPLLDKKKAPRWAALLALGWALPIMGWTARNYVRYRAVIPISAQMGWTLWEGFSLDREEVRRRPTEMDEEARRAGANTAVERSNYFKAKTLRFIRENPLEAARIVVGKAFLYWRPWPYDPYTPIQRLGLGAYYIFLFALAGVGAWSLRGMGRRWLPVGALFLYLTASHAVFFTSLRYRLPLEPFLCLLGARGLRKLRRTL